MQHPAIGHDDAKSAVTFREMRSTSWQNAENPLVAQLAKLKSFYAALEEKPEVLLVLDQLDEEYAQQDASEKSKYADTLRSLFSAAVDIHSLGFGIKPLVLLREDIFESFEGANKGKLSDDTICLDWDTSELRDIIAHRLSKNSGDQQPLFEKAWLRLFVPFFHVGTDRHPVSSIECFLNHTTRTPRDCVVLIKFVADRLVSNRVHKKCDASVFLEARELFADYFYRQLIDAIHPKFEWAKRLLLALQQGTQSQVLERKHLIQIFSSIEKTEADLDCFLAALYEQGAIGLLSTSSRLRTKYYGDRYAPRIADQIVLHPALATKLRIEVPISGYAKDITLR